MRGDQVTRPNCNTISEVRDGETGFLLDPADNDRFMRTGRQVIEHCRLGISVETWVSEVKDLLGHVAEWCKKQGGRVRACYAAPGAKVTLFFVPASECYNFELGAELAELNVRLVQTFNVGMIETRQIPWAERERFIDEGSQRVYGEPE